MYNLSHYVLNGSTYLNMSDQAVIDNMRYVECVYPSYNAWIAVNIIGLLFIRMNRRKDMTNKFFGDRDETTGSLLSIMMYFNVFMFLMNVVGGML